MTADEARKLAKRHVTPLSICYLHIKAKATQGYSGCSVYFTRVNEEKLANKLSANGFKVSFSKTIKDAKTTQVHISWRS